MLNSKLYVKLADLFRTGMAFAVALLATGLAHASGVNIGFNSSVTTLTDPANIDAFFGQSYAIDDAVSGSFSFPASAQVLSFDTAGIASGTDYFLAPDAGSGGLQVGANALVSNGQGSAISIRNDSSSALMGDQYIFSTAVDSDPNDSLGFIALVLVNSAGTLFDSEEFFELDSLAGFDFGFWVVGGQFGDFDAIDRMVLDSFAGGVVNINSISFAVTPSPVPIPAALPLFASGLIGLALFRRRKVRIEL